MTYRFVFVIGGVISGLGKGIFTASLSKTLQLAGYSVNPIKIDPYLNVDAGTMRPTEHGEVWVTYDGGEIDQDLGTYERFLGIKFSKENNLTSGKILWKVINDERHGRYLGKTVQYIPHVLDAIEDYLVKLAQKSKADINLVEVGGTVGDYEIGLFLHTVVRMMRKYQCAVIFMGYLLYPPHIRELKTKPLQHSLSALFSYGIYPDILVVRTPSTLDTPRLEKITKFSGLPKEKIFALPDIDNIYKIPLNIIKHKGVIKTLEDSLGIKIEKRLNLLPKLKEYATFIKEIERLEKNQNKIGIGIVGKYFGTGDYVLTDSYISVIESIKFASWQAKQPVDIRWIDSTTIDENTQDEELKNRFQDIKAIIVPGGFGSTGVSGKLRTIRFARENKIPYLGLCYGMQLAIVEFARNVLGLKNANTTEIDKDTPHPVIDILPEQKNILEGKRYGASMRLGEYKAYVLPESLVFKLYRARNRLLKDKKGYYVIERHRHRYEVNPEYHEILQQKGLIFSGISEDKRLVEFIELDQKIHPFFVATQAHPEFTSYLQDPNPMFWGLIKSASS